MPESNTPTNNLPEFQGTIEINRMVDASLPDDRICGVLSCILADAGFSAGSISVAIVDDATIHQLNRQYLDHDWPTDVLSFLLEEDRAAGWLNGEVVVSQETAARQAAGYSWTSTEELLLYLIHGTLHLAGFDDADEALRREMRQAEDRYLARAGIARPPSPVSGKAAP